MNVNLMQNLGNWDLGYVLDWHVESSEFLGHNQFGRPEFDTKYFKKLFIYSYRTFSFW
uniref:Uncharacterized protein n=1 Tax=uncultured Desulfobacterium sp. TaxID=201089 RepID=E1YMT9_9BACT|nr:unknown protein [uncultured Desulfobacterium sp.]